MVMRAGRAHDPAGILATKEGECVVLCPACPHPGINMPDGWEQTTEQKQYICDIRQYANVDFARLLSKVPPYKICCT